MYFSTFFGFSTTKNVDKILLFQYQKQHYFPESWPLFFYFIFLFHFMSVPDANPDPKTEPLSIPVQVPLGQKVTVPAIPIPQHIESFH
jgi:hypothetical protein